MREPVHTVVAMLGAGLVGAGAPAAIDNSKIVDLTHAFDERTIYWPTAKPFEWTKESWGRNAAGNWYTAGRYAASSMAAPISTPRSTSPKDARRSTRSRSPGWSARRW